MRRRKANGSVATCGRSVSRYPHVLMKVALDFVWKEAIQGPFPVYVGLVSARAGDSLSGDPFRL